jgi:glucose-6-phosphate 1-epimerase
MMSLMIVENEFGHIKQVTLNAQVSVLEIKHNSCTAKISLYGGQVLAWQPQHQQAIFWLSDDAVFKEGTAIRGGIPICWPWFGPYQAANGEIAGNHGFARQKQWTLGEVEINQDSVCVTLVLTGENEHPLWPHRYQLKQAFTFSQAFEQQLFISNLSSKSFEYSAALHSYFAVSSPEHTNITPLADMSYDDKVTGKDQQAARLANCVGVIDRVYHSDKTCFIEDKQWQRTIKVSSTNCQQWVLWNPGIDIAEGMSDVHRGAENEFVCLEAANTETHTVNAGESVMIGQRISLL